MSARSTEAAVVEDELSRLGLVGRPPVDLVCAVVVRAREIASDPGFQPLDPGAVFHGSSVEQERFRWAAMRAAREFRRELRRAAEEQ